MNIPNTLKHLTTPAQPHLPSLYGVLTSEGEISKALWLDETRLILAHKGSQQLDIWDTQSQQKELSLELPRSDLSLLERMPDGRGLLASFGDQLALIDLEWGSVRAQARPYGREDDLPHQKRAPRSGSPSKLLISPDSTTAYLFCQPQREASFYAWLVGEEGFSWSWPDTMFPVVDASLYKDTLALFHPDRVSLIELYTRQPILSAQPLRLPEGFSVTHGLMLSSERALLLLGAPAKTEVYIIDCALKQPPSSSRFWKEQSRPHITVKEPFLFVRGEHVFYLGDAAMDKSRHGVRLGGFVLSTGEEPEPLFFTGHALRFAALSPNHDRLAIVTKKDQILLFRWR